MNISIEQLNFIVPNAPKNAYAFIPHLNTTIAKYDITTRNRACMFLAQIAHESGSFRYTKETASGKAYEGRKDLGNVIEGDGKKYKGRGLIQVTGRANYKLCGADLGLDLITHPELLETPLNAMLSAGWFWDKHELNKYADLPDTWRSKTKKYTPFEMVTYLINGGQNGIAERKAFYNRALEVIK